MNRLILFTAIVSQVLAISPPPVANLNERCGGENNLSCNLGLYCEIPKGRKSGVCKRGLPVGAYCLVPTSSRRPPCGRGLVCQSVGRGRYECVKPKAKLGQACGGISLDAMTCDTGLICFYDPNNLPGAAGVCTAPRPFKVSNV